MSYLPLTASDLREIARTLEETVRKFGEENVNELTKFGEKFYQINLEVLRPGGHDVIGRITYEDGWLGFIPTGEVTS